tara:strand:+ start:51 stop:230 length:180 start_codon:yes stop_codon:yes gene_type:complete
MPLAQAYARLRRNMVSIENVVRQASCRQARLPKPCLQAEVLFGTQACTADSPWNDSMWI